MDKPNYYAILPAKVRYDDRLNANAKLLYAEITALSNSKGYCWSTNRYFANLYNVSVTSISKWISKLIEVGYLESKIEYKDGTKEILNRHLILVECTIEKKLNTPIESKLKDNNKEFNNINSNNKFINKGNLSENENLKNSLIPNLETFIDYAKEVYQQDLKLDYQPYDFTLRAKYQSWMEAGWKDGNDKPIKNWKSKLKNTIPHLKPIYGKFNSNNTNDSNTTQNRNSYGGSKVSGKVSASSILAKRAREQFAGDCDSGNQTVQT